MSDAPVNLNRYRKNKARAEKRARADANAAKFGRSKADRQDASKQAETLQRHLDNHSLSNGEDSAPSEG